MFDCKECSTRHNFHIKQLTEQNKCLLEMLTKRYVTEPLEIIVTTKELQEIEKKIPESEIKKLLYKLYSYKYEPDKLYIAFHSPEVKQIIQEIKKELNK